MAGDARPPAEPSAAIDAFDCRRTAAVVGGLAAIILTVIAVVNRPLAVALAAEHSVIERLQVVFFAAAAMLTARYAWTAARGGRAIPLEIAIVTGLVMACVSEVDLDRLLFGVKVVAPRFFFSSRYPVELRLAALLVIVGIPTAIVVWIASRGRAFRADVQAALRTPWGQTAAYGIVLYVVAQTLERPIDKIWWNPHHLIEEAAEMIGALAIFIALAARHGLGLRHFHARGRQRFASWLSHTRSEGGD